MKLISFKYLERKRAQPWLRLRTPSYDGRALAPHQAIELNALSLAKFFIWSYQRLY